MQRHLVSLAASFLLLLLATQPVFAVPPLTPSQQMRLKTARDGRDHREEAFIALLEHVRTWPADSAGATSRPAALPDPDQLLNDPEAHRGRLVHITGRLEQHAVLHQPERDIQEWFIRIESGDPLIVYLPALASAADAPPPAGRRVELLARFYKRIDATDRQGRHRRYAAFVGAFPRVIPAPAVGSNFQPWVLLAPVMALLVGLLLLLLLGYIRRQRSRNLPPRRRALIADDGSAVLDEPADLPDDPAEALAELKRRAEPS